MQHYPTTTIVKALTRIRRERLLPQAGEIAVRVGQEVSPVQVVVRASRDSGFRIMNAAREMNLPPADLPKYMQVEVGAAVQRGTPLVRSKGGLLGGRGKKFSSPVDGILHQVYNGMVIIQQTPELLELRAMMQGRVAAMISNRGVALETNGSLIQAWWDNGQEGYGKIRVLANAPDGTVHPSQLGNDVRGTILVVGRLNELTLLQKAEDSQVRGIIAGSMPTQLCLAAAAFSFPVVLTEGVGSQPMADPIYKLLHDSEGREASLFSRTTLGQQGAGGRPEIVIPVPASVEGQKLVAGQPISTGQNVRILSAPYRSQVGRVAAVHSHPHTTAIGSRAPGADVELPGGEVVFIPFSNLDIIL
jgi:hypothetical protein